MGICGHPIITSYKTLKRKHTTQSLQLTGIMVRKSGFDKPVPNLVQITIVTVVSVKIPLFYIIGNIFQNGNPNTQGSRHQRGVSSPCQDLDNQEL